MIFGNLNNINDYSFLSSDIKECFEYAENNKLYEYENGSYQISGNRLYVNVAEYKTKNKKDGFWEAHKKYIDVHLILSGTERIDIAFSQNATLKEYLPEQDFLSLDASENAKIILNKNDFLICFPNDCHMTGIAAGDSCKVKKAIFKVLII